MPGVSLCKINEILKLLKLKDKKMLKYYRIKNLLFPVGLFMILTGIVMGQSTTATLSGSVVDEKEAAIAGAVVKITNTNAGFERTVSTNSNGTFVIPLLPPAAYEVTVESSGFATFGASNIVLNASDQKSLSIILRVGQIGGSVQVTTETPLIDESTAVSTTIDRTFVSNLPMNGRSIQSLIRLAPGVVSVPTSSGSQGQFSVNGQRANSNYFTVDGISGNFSASNNESFAQNASGSLPSANIQGGFQNLASVDALQEFSIQTSTFAPEFGRGPGAQVQLVTRSGQNQYHGSLYNYFRNDVFDARDFFDPVKPPLRFNNFGGTFGGPVLLPRFGEGGPSLWKGTDKTYFFFSYEGQRFVLPQPPITVTVPSLAFRASAPTDISKAILNAHPLPNGAELKNAAGNLTGGALFTTVFSNPQSSDTYSARVDHNFTKNFTLFGRFNYSPSKAKNRSTSNPSAFSTNTQTTNMLTLGSTQVFGTKLVNEIRANYSRQEGFSESGFDGFGGGVLPPTSIFLPDGVGTQRRFSLFGISGVFGGLTFGDVVKNENRQMQFIDNLSYRIGSHQLKFGGDYRRLEPTLSASDLIASVNPGTLNNLFNDRLQSLGLIRLLRYTSLFETYYFYGQDTWKASKRLTLTYGLGWNINPSPTGTSGKIPYTLAAPPDFSQLDQSSLALAPLGTPYYQTDFTKFSPRFGLAYQFSQTPGRELVLRGGIGVFYDLGQTGFGNAGFPYRNSITRTNVPLPIPASFLDIPERSLTLGPTNRASVTAAAADYTLPRTYQWNLTAEQSLGRDQTISVGYVAALGRDLVSVRRVEIGLPGQFPGSYFSPNFSDVTLINNGAESSYHSLQAQFTRRLSKGLQAIASYTWSHSIDNESTDQSIDAPGFTFPQDAYRGDSDFDVRHNFSGALTYVIPAPKGNNFYSGVFGGWSINGIFSARTGLPYSVSITELTPSFFFSSYRRPSLTGQPIYLDDPNVATGRRLNPAAFNFVLPQGQMGNLGRNSLRGPGFFQIDTGIHRTFKLHEKLKMQFRWEVFNIFNHPSFLYPTVQSGFNLGPFGGLIIDPNFGVVTRTIARSSGGGGNSGGLNPLFQNGGPRSMQFALRFDF
jgi:hypothetical protein